MTADQFNKVLEARIGAIRAVLESKAQEYASGDRLHNFKANAGALNTSETPEQVLWGYLRKHLQSIYDMVEGLKKPTPAQVIEKIGDAVNYLILLEALFLEPYMETRN